MELTDETFNISMNLNYCILANEEDSPIAKDTQRQNVFTCGKTDVI